MTRRFRDRRAGGLELAPRLAALELGPDPIVLALPRGGVPVGYEVARFLRAPLDLLVVRKLGAPGYAELALGAIASGGARVLNHDIVRQLGVGPTAMDEIARRERLELERRELAYRDGRPAPALDGRGIVLVDDGLATGATMRAAVLALRSLGVARLTIAVPVAPPDVCDEFRREVDAVVCALTPEPFQAVGVWYEDFGQTTDDEVRDLLARAASERAPSREASEGEA